MRDFFALPVCVRGSQTEDESGLEDGKHKAPCLRPTRRPPIASAPCLKSLPQCHLPSCSQTHCGPNNSLSRHKALTSSWKVTALRGWKHALYASLTAMLFLSWSSFYLIFVCLSHFSPPLLAKDYCCCWQKIHQTSTQFLLFLIMRSFHEHDLKWIISFKIKQIIRGGQIDRNIDSSDTNADIGSILLR